MSTAAVTGCTILGVDAIPVNVEVDVRPGLPVVAVVGLPDRAVAESACRVRSALANSGFRLPPRRVTVNLAPADVPKHGAGLDLPIAAALMVAAGHLPAGKLSGIGLWGQLSLTGDVGGVAGSLPAALCFRQAGFGRIATSPGDAALAGLAGIEVYPVRSLTELARPDWPQARKTGAASCGRFSPRPASLGESERCFLAIRGQEGPKRVLLLAAAGGHSLVLLGPPGVGKSLIARALHALLPPLAPPELLDVARVASAGGHAVGNPVGDGVAFCLERPLRTPSHTAGLRLMFGGGSPPAPGEVTLAHGGVLVLDELPLFRPEVLAGVSRALDLGHIPLYCRRREVRLPARFQLAATSNLCPCGRAGAPDGGCGCTPVMRRNHYRRMSAQLLDRIDFHLEIPAVGAHDLLPAMALPPEPGAELARARQPVELARAKQAARYGPGITNATVDQELFEPAALTTQAARDLLERARLRLGLSTRGCILALRVARTAADLEGCEAILPGHVAEAVAYRWRPPR